MVVLWPRQFVVDVLTRRPAFDSGPVRVAFAMDAVAGYIQSTLSILVAVFPSQLHTHISFIYQRRYIILATDSVSK
jgi:hypothetical protein